MNIKTRSRRDETLDLLVGPYAISLMHYSCPRHFEMRTEREELRKQPPRYRQFALHWKVPDWESMEKPPGVHGKGISHLKWRFKIKLAFSAPRSRLFSLLTSCCAADDCSLCSLISFASSARKLPAIPRCVLAPFLARHKASCLVISARNRQVASSAREHERYVAHLITLEAWAPTETSSGKSPASPSPAR